MNKRKRAKACKQVPLFQISFCNIFKPSTIPSAYKRPVYSLESRDPLMQIYLHENIEIMCVKVIDKKKSNNTIMQLKV